MVSAATVERGGERPHVPGDVGADVDGRVELPAGEHRQVVVAVGQQVLDVVQGGVVGPAPVQQGHLVTGGEGGLDHGAAHETGAADEEDAHGRTVALELTRPGARRAPRGVRR